MPSKLEIEVGRKEMEMLSAVHLVKLYTEVLAL